MIKYQLTKSEVISAHHKHRRSAIPQRTITSVAVLSVAMLFVIETLEPTSKSEHPYRLTCWLIVIGATAFVLLPRFVDWFVALAVSKSANFNLPMQVSFTQLGLVYVDPKCSRTVEWRWYSCMTEDEHFYYLLRHGWWVDSLPKRAFDTTNLEGFLKCSQSVPRA